MSTPALVSWTLVLLRRPRPPRPPLRVWDSWVVSRADVWVSALRLPASACAFRTRVRFSMQAVCVRVYAEKHTFGGLPRFFLCGSPAAVLDGPGAAGGGADDASLLFLFLLPFGRPRRRFSGAVGSAALARGGKIARARVRISISGRS